LLAREFGDWFLDPKVHRIHLAPSPKVREKRSPSLALHRRPSPPLVEQDGFPPSPAPGEAIFHTELRFVRPVRLVSGELHQPAMKPQPGDCPRRRPPLAI
jgi:hypothetical protein